MSTASTKPAVRPLPVARFLGLLINVLCVLLGIRFLLLLAGANIDQPLVALLLTFTDPFSAPFEGIFSQSREALGNLTPDLGALFAIGVLQLVALLLRVLERRTSELL